MTIKEIRQHKNNTIRQQIFTYLIHVRKEISSIDTRFFTVSLTKPFSINELMARVNSLIRRYTLLNPVSSPETDCMTFQGMTIDSLNRLVFQGNEQIELTGKEFDLLSFLASNKGKVFTKKQIYMQVWAEEYAFDDSNIMSFISKLRKKIEPDPEHPFYILTVRGVGYRFNREA